MRRCRKRTQERFKLELAKIFKKLIRLGLIFLVCYLNFLPTTTYASANSEAFNYMTAEINSLGWVRQAFITASPKPNSPERDFYEQMKDIKIAINQLQTAGQEIYGFRNSTNQFISGSSNTLLTGYAYAIKLFQDHVSLIEAAMNMPPKEFMSHQGTLTSQLASNEAEFNKFWSDLFMVVSRSTNALADFDRMEGDKHPYLLISKDEESKLLKQLDETFGDEIKMDIKEIENKSVSAPAMIRFFLTTTKLKPSDS